MQAPQRTIPGKLENGRINARESAVIAHHTKQMAKVSFDFDFDGAADPAFKTILPANSVILAAHVFVDTALTGATAMTLTIGSFTVDLVANSTIESATGYSAVAITAATIGTTASEITAPFTGTATAGKFRIMVEYINTDRF